MLRLSCIEMVKSSEGAAKTSVCYLGVDVKVETVVDYGGCVVLYGGIIWRGIWRVCRFISDLLVCM